MSGDQEALREALDERLPVQDSPSQSNGVTVDLAVHFGTRAGLIDHIVDIVQLTRVGDEERLRAALDRDLLAGAINDLELRANLSTIVETNLGTHRADCIHVGWIADRYEAAPQPPSPASQGEER